ncbi:aspartic peptidase a1 [Ceraceosorus bombacis]|uniref:Aspartic peptidase a1 n=1 Tax=Ceraceosorus bombacis TaxID=401625 RepID=A0A0P1BBT4_9BASI|nr:aspartic peptidase a1 [Ceraceosorus bombacis]
MQLAGQSTTAQTFALATAVTRGLLNQAIDGIAGLGFKALSTAKATPLWQNVGLSQADEIFSFFLQREIDSGNPENTQYGGVFTLGGTNSSLYQGDINWSEVIDESYWLITLGGITLQNNTVSIGNTVNAAIDTGTTLIGGPSSVIADLYSQIPGSSPSTQSEGYYNYPCATNVSASVTFGNQAYVLSPSDFLAGATDRTGETCLGAFFSVGSDQTTTLQWIVGAAFLKSVYSVFDYNSGKPRVGFAALADGLNGGTESSTVAQTQTAKVGGNGASSLHRVPLQTLLATLTATCCVFAVWP